MGADHAQIWHWTKLLCFWLQQEIRLNVYNLGICGLIAHLGGWRKRDQDSEDLRRQQGGGEWVWPNGGNWTSNWAWGATVGPEVQEGPGLGAERQSERQKVRKDTRRREGPVLHPSSTVSSRGWKIFWLGWLELKHRVTVVHLETCWRLCKPTEVESPPFPQAVMNMRCAWPARGEQMRNQVTTVVCWWCSGQRKPPLIRSTQADRKGERT